MTRAIDPRRHPQPHNDVEALGHKVPGFDALHYYDQQEAQAAQSAASRWPRLAQWLAAPIAGDSTLLDETR